MKTVLLAVLLLVGAGSAVRAQTYYLDLTNQTLNVPEQVVRVEKVVDGRAGNPPIGIAYRAGKSVAIGFREGVEPELTKFISSQLPDRLTDHPVVLCLRRLELSEVMGGTKEQATAALAADVYEHLPDGYHFVQVVTAQANTLGREVTYRHAEHLVGMLNQCLGQLTEANWSAVAARPVRTLAELPTDQSQAGSAGRRAAPAVLREPLRRGLYLRFDQFLANRPDTAMAFHLDTLRRVYRNRLATVKWLGVARVRPKGRLGADNNVPLPSLWGFCDGRQAYMKYGKEYYPLMRQGNSFTFVGETPLDQFYEAAFGQAQGRAGMIGGVSGAMLASTNVPDHTDEPMAYGLDMSTGAASPFPGLRTPLRSDTSYVYIYRPAQTAGAELVHVVVEGKELGVLRAGQYLEVPWGRFGKPMHLCLLGVPAANPCQQVVPNTTQLNYLKLDASKGAQPWQWMPPARGSADLDELDKRSK